MHISIHAPARGATCVTPSAFTISADFNPRSREGSDAIRQGHREPFSYFNPRSREGSDLPPWILLYSSKISIHAPARGATFPRGHDRHVDRISIHAPARGATL